MTPEERQRMAAKLRAAIATVERFANREYVEGFDNEYAQLIRGVVRPFTEAADQIERDGKRLVEAAKLLRDIGNDAPIDWVEERNEFLAQQDAS